MVDYTSFVWMTIPIRFAWCITREAVLAIAHAAGLFKVNTNHETVNHLEHAYVQLLIELAAVS